MAQRSCAHCGGEIRTLDKRARYCGDSCRAAAAYVRKKTGDAPAPTSGAAPSDKVQGPLGRELQELGVADSYEGAIALGLAAQLDGGTVTGTAYVSLSKELDRRVEDLRRKAPRPDDRTVQAREAVQARRLRLASG